MTDSQYAEFCEDQVAEYARQLACAGEASVESSTDLSRNRLQDLTADCLRTVGHEFFVATSVPGCSKVGWLWLSPPPDFLGPGHEYTRWLSQLTVDRQHRGCGWGKAILVAAEQYLSSLGTKQLWLRVFDWNTAARRLYASLGYELACQFETDAHLRKMLA